MKDNQAKYPQLRFKGFTDPWDKRYLGDYVVDYTEKTTQENQFPVLTSSQQQGIVLQSEYFSDRQVTTDENIGYFVLPRGYFTYRSRSDNNIFVFNRNDIIDKGIISYFYPVFGLINADSNFFLRRINNGLNRQLAIAAEGTGQHVLSLKKFKKMETRFPSLPEQKQIGEFLECLDDLITVNQRKLAKLKELKQGYLQKMFPKNGAKVPELRFAGFADAWEQRKLTEIVNRVNKSSNSDVLPKVEFEDIVSGEGRLNKDISSKLDSRKGTLFESENILYGKLRPYLKNWLFPDFKGVALGDFWVFEATDVSVPSFDYYLIQSDDYQKVANDTSGTKMPRSDWKNVSSTDFAIPSKDEQKQIGSFFKQLDNIITLHQRKLEKLQELKKGYLQKVFC